MALDDGTDSSLTPCEAEPQAAELPLPQITFPYSSKINFCFAFGVHQNSPILMKQRRFWEQTISRTPLQVFLMEKESNLMTLQSFPSHLCRSSKSQEEWQPSLNGIPQRYLFYPGSLTPCGAENGEELLSPHLRLKLNWVQIKLLMEFRRDCWFFLPFASHFHPPDFHVEIKIFKNQNTSWSDQHWEYWEYRQQVTDNQFLRPKLIKWFGFLLNKHLKSKTHSLLAPLKGFQPRLAF